MRTGDAWCPVSVTRSHKTCERHDLKTRPLGRRHLDIGELLPPLLQEVLQVNREAPERAAQGGDTVVQGWGELRLLAASPPDVSNNVRLSISSTEPSSPPVSDHRLTSGFHLSPAKSTSPGFLFHCQVRL